MKSYNIGKIAVKVKVEDRKLDDMSEKDKRENELTHQLFQIAHEVLEKKGYKLSSMSADPRSLIFTSIMEETDKRFDEVTGFAYSFYPMPLQMIEIKREELSVEKIPYKIIVKGEEHNQLN